MLLYLLPNQAHPQLSKILTLEPIRDLVAAPFRHIDVSHLFNRSFQGKVAQPRCERSTMLIRVGGRCLLLFLFGGTLLSPNYTNTHTEGTTQTFYLLLELPRLTSLCTTSDL